MTEKSEAKRDGATLQPNSGRGRFAKGDAVLDGWCLDYKEYAKSFTVSMDVWAKISTDAFKAGNLEPALKLILGSGQQKIRLFVISESMFELMHEAYKEKYEQV